MAADVRMLVRMTETPEQQARHERQHELLAARREAFLSLPMRSERERLRRREAYKRYVWSLIGHLRQMHGERDKVLALRAYAVLESRHDRLHDS